MGYDLLLACLCSTGVVLPLPLLAIQNKVFSSLLWYASFMGNAWVSLLGVLWGVSGGGVVCLPCISGFLPHFLATTWFLRHA